jgi:hypothetical protein
MATRAAASFKMKDGSTHDIDLSKIADIIFQLTAWARRHPCLLGVALE